MTAKVSYLGEDLIFIISQPRSGSTLLQRVLSGHPDIQTSAETWLMLHPAYGLRYNKGIKTDYDAGFTTVGVKEFLQNYTDGEQVYTDAVREWARVIYGNALLKGGKKYFLDKTPRYFFIIAELYRFFPKAKFVFLIRNPMAVLASELKTYVKGDWNVLSVFEPDLRRAPAWILAGIELLGTQAITIKYEDFVADPERNIAELCARLNLEFHATMLNYGDTPVPKGKMNDPVGIHQHTRPSTDSVDKWKELSGDSQSRHLALHYLADLGPDTINRLGYSYPEIENTLRAGVAKGTGMIFPWHVAITRQEDWSFRQRALAAYYFASKKYGRLAGTIVAGIQLVKYLLKLLKHCMDTGYRI